MTTVLVTRHGETTWNREGRVQGWAPSRLTERGRREAAAAGQWLDERYDVDWLVASDLRRTRETAAHIRAAMSEPSAGGAPEPVFEPGLRERGFGMYQGLHGAELAEEFPDHDTDTSVSSLDAAPPDGESVDAFTERVRLAWDRLCAVAGEDETVLAVTHGGVIKVLLSELTGRETTTALTEHSQANCAVNEIAVTGEDCELAAEALTEWRDRLSVDG